jgi:hypothetical protein
VDEQNAPNSPEIPEKPPVDPGCLPAWKVDELPAPVPFRWGSILALIGPGIVLIGSTIGTGEWVVGSGVAALYRGALLWVAPVAILCQAILNSEAMRYTLVTGEPVFTGFLRSRPGPKFWLLWYLFLDSLSWLPALAGLAAQILLFTFTGSDPISDHVRIVSVGLLLLCALLLCFGGKIYNTLEVVQSGKVVFVLVYLLIVTIIFVPLRVWGEVVGGMVNPFRVPEDVDWSLIGAVAGFAGIGGLANILASNYVREKGWGMGAKVGSIPSAIGGKQIRLSHIGTMARPTPEAVRRFNQWWTQVRRDQFGLWAWGSVLGMLLPCVLGAAFLQSNYFQQGSQAKAAIGLAQDFGAVHGQVFLILTLLCAFIIMFPGQFSSMDGIARRWTDAIWSGTARARAADPHKVKYVYYSFVAIYVTVGIIINGLGVSPKNMMVFNANLANLAITCSIVHTLYVNCRFLPKEFQPPLLQRLGLVFAALFYFGIFSLVTHQTIMKALSGTLFG